MNRQTDNHPERGILVDFGLGRLDPSKSSWIEEHLSGCAECCETLLHLKDDTFAEIVRSLPEPEVADERRVDATGRAMPRTDPLDTGTVPVPSGEPVMTSELPTELADHPRYRIVERIGRGGMGDVYRAEHRLMNRSVALKVINSRLVSHPQAVERFRREVQAAAQLSHPNIVTAYDAEQAGRNHFLVMEFVDGTDLASVVQQRGPLSVAETCDAIRQAALGLQHAHERGMVHRDIKPHNLMLSPNGTVRILDFGLAGFATEAAAPTEEGSAGASAQQHLTTIGGVMGTPDYISPEQARDARSADIRSDIYSLGCTLCFLLTGKPLFAADTVINKLKAHIESAPPALEELRPDVPQELATILKRMLAKDPAARLQTPAEVAEALAPFVKPAAPPPRRRSRTLVTTALAGAAILFAGLIVIATGRGRLEIQSEVDDVQVVVEQNGEQVAIVDLKTGSQVKWLATGGYELKLKGGDQNDVTLDQRGFTMSRLGKVIVTARWSTEGRGTLASFNPPAEPITQDGVTVADGGWKITAKETQTVRLFEPPLPPLAAGPFFYRAKLKTENVKGRAFLEMWVRFPGEGEFFSKGFHNAVSGTNGWAEYQIPFYLKKGQQPDMAKLNLTIEGSGTVWIKDVEVRGRTDASDIALGDASTIAADVPDGAMSETVTTGYNGSFEVTKSGLPVSWSFYTPRTVPNSDFDIVMDKMDFKEGEQSLKFVVRKCEPTGGRLSPGFFNEFRIANFSPPAAFETKPGETYKISFWAKNAASEFVFKARGVSAFGGDKGTVVRSKETIKEWRRFECIYTIPPKTWLRLELNVVQPGTFWIDDLQIVRVNDKAAAVPGTRTEVGQVTIVPDEQRLQGKWVAVSASFRGKALTDEQLARFSITLTGDRAELTDPDSGQAMTGTFTIDASRSPKHIDFIAPEGKERAPGIFAFDGEHLKVAWVDGDYARPTDFEPAETPDHMTGVFQRVPGSAPVSLPQDEPIAVPALDDEQQAVLKAAEAYLAVMDEGRFGELRDMVSSIAKQHVTREQVSQTYQKLRDTFGKATHRTLNRVQVYDEFPNLPPGRYAGVQYKTDFERQKGLWESLLLNVDTDGQWRVNTYANTLEPMPFPEPKQDPVIEQKLQLATSAAQDWLTLVDAGKYGESWEASAKINRDGISKEKLIDAYKELFQPLGAIKSRTFKSSEYTTQMPRAPVGEYAVIQFNTQLTNGRIIETVILMRESDGQWHVAGYRHAEDNSPPTPPRAISKPPQRKTGLLTNPPKLPPEGLPVGRNLIVDPSLEETATGELPSGWFAWLDDGPDFICEVVEGGVTGKHCLQISGTGTRGVVFATNIPLDRTKRYALKGRVKVEGEAGTWAVIKLNYFNNTGWLGVDDRVGLTTSDLDWKLLEKTDVAEKYPAATLLVPTCHIEGNGTAWFDDLEVIAYDREKLPENFNATHGKNNRMK